VGIELYQTLLEEAVLASRGETAAAEAGEWSPQIALGMAVLLPETYVADLPVRLALYRRLGTLMSRDEVEGFAAELIDRFGPLPPEAKNLLDTVAIKLMCKAAGVEKVDAGPKGAVLSFRHNRFANPAGLVKFIGGQLGTVKLRPDHRLVIARPWDEPALRLKGVAEMVGKLAEVAAAEDKAA
jgi:transcription-repair coupling factor (superfamily II helicase)